MAENPNNPLDVNIVNLMGAHSIEEFLHTSGMSQFASEVRALKDSVNTMTTALNASVKAQQNMAEFYKQGGSGFESRGQRPGLLGPNGEPLSGGEQARSGERSSGSSAPNQPEVSDIDMGLKSALRDAHKAYGKSRESGASMGASIADAAAQYQYKRGTIDLPDVEPTSGGGGSGTGPSAGASTGGRPDPRLQEPPVPLKIPQIGEFQIDTLFQALGGSFQKSAERKYREAEAENLSEEEREKMLRQAKNRGTAAYGLYKAGEFAPKAALAKQYFNATIGNIEDLGSQANAYGTGGQIGTEGFGFSIPLISPQFRKGLQEQFQVYKRSLKPGLNKEEARFIDNELYQLGYGGGDATNAMRDAMDRVMQGNKNAGKDPATARILDQASRYGQGNLNELVHILKNDLPEAAKAAHVSQAQLRQDILAYQEAIEASGGTHVQAARDISTFARNGMEPGAVAEFTQNPFYQSAAFRSTGLMPNAQGVMSSGQKNQTMIQALNDVAQMSSGFAPISRKAAGTAGEYGLKYNFSAYDQQIGMMAEQTGMSPDQLRKLIDPNTGQVRKGYENLVNMTANAEGYSKQFGEQARKEQFGGKTPVAALNTSEKLKKDNVWTWGEQIKSMRDAEMLDEDGNRIRLGDKFKDEINEIKGYREDDVRELKKGGITAQERKELREINTERMRKVKEFNDKHNLGDSQLGDQDKGKVKIELAGAAKTFFKLIDKREGHKADVGAAAVNAGMNSLFGPAQTQLLSTLGDVTGLAD